MKVPKEKVKTQKEIYKGSKRKRKLPRHKSRKNEREALVNNDQQIIKASLSAVKKAIG